MIKTVDKNELENLADRARPVLVDFYAEWCSPCKMLAPVVERLESEYGRHFDVVKVNIDKNPDLAERYSVSGVPTLLLLKNGGEAARIVGAMPIDAVISKLSEKTGESFV